tara:strand:+ start:1823 stop:2710 length:888 start_codon:yes stop_codon:yes gene_type:complete
MSGRYAKAPLIYMTAKIKTTPLPNLTSDQWALIEQLMVKNGLPEKVTSKVKEISFNASNESSQEESPVSTSYVNRHGFFSADRSNALIIEKDGIEWRTSSYIRYAFVCEKFQQILEALCEQISAYQFVPTQELSLSYVDLIAPIGNRTLSEYFSNSDKILPLSAITGSEKDLQNFGLLQINRIVEPNKRIFISLDQLPVIEGRPSRFLPQNMMEPDNKLSMPLKLRDEWSNILLNHYALLTTQAALLTNTSLKDLKFQDACKPIHSLTRETFKGLINKEVCDIDWEYITDGSQGA